MHVGQSIPEDYDIVSVHGFVEELLFNVDPEHQVHIHVCHHAMSHDSHVI